jgi:hypothetical protein
MNWLPMVIADIHDLANNALPASEPLRSRLSGLSTECHVHHDLTTVSRALHRRIVALESQHLGCASEY